VRIAPKFYSFLVGSTSPSARSDGAISSTRCVAYQPFAAGGSQSYPDVRVVTGGPWYPRNKTPTTWTTEKMPLFCCRHASCSFRFVPSTVFVAKLKWGIFFLWFSVVAVRGYRVLADKLLICCGALKN
jgi:hypothetical protein